MKKLFFIVGMFFVSMNFAFAQDESEIGICQYTDGKNTFTVEFGKESWGQKNAYLIYYTEEILVSNYNLDYVNSMYCGPKPYYPYTGTASEYMEAGNGCPSYVHVGDFNGSFAFFSEEDSGESGCTTPNEVLKSIDLGVNIDEETGETTIIDDVSILTFSGHIYGVDKKFDLTINKTKKTFSVSDVNFQMMEAYDEFGSFEKLFACRKADNSGKYVIYSTMERLCEAENTETDDCNLQYLNDCSYFYPKDSEKYLIHDGCPLYGKYFSTYKENQDKNSLSVLKNYCSSIFANHGYSVNKYSCINLCLNLEDNLVDLGIVESNDRVCGFSEKLIIYIANIVKWGKYLVPVIVIVLGILDFIQAIAADKDDGMKKAQGRFVKRLIAAALIFIIPFIIEFVLDKMGFGSNGCGIIDL